MPYAKAIVPLVLGALATLVQLIVTDEFNTSELQTLIASIVTAVTVYATPNRPSPV